MWKLSNLIHANHPQQLIHRGSNLWIPARPLNEDYDSFRKRLKEAWMVFTRKASAFTWD